MSESDLRAFGESRRLTAIVILFGCLATPGWGRGFLRLVRNLGGLALDKLRCLCDRGEISLAAAGQPNERQALVRQLRAEPLQRGRSMDRLVSDRPGERNELYLLGDELFRQPDPIQGELDVFTPVH